MTMTTTRLLISFFLVTCAALLCTPVAAKVRILHHVADVQTNKGNEPATKILTARDFENNRVERGSGSEEVTFIIEINPKLPPFIFRLIPDPTAKFPMNCDCSPHVGTIEILRQGVQEALQEIEVKSDTDSSWFINRFKAIDVNFDGYLDIAVVSEFGAKWASYHYWLFDPASDRFITNKLTRELGKLSSNELKLDPTLKTIHLSFLQNDQARIGETYKIENGDLELIEVTERQKDCDGHFETVSVKIINGKREGKDVIPLGPCRQITQTIAGGQIHRYEMRLDAGHSVHVELDATLDLELALFGPDGKLLLDLEDYHRF